MSETAEVTKRGVGRPPKNDLKKGHSSWRPANVSEVSNKEPGFRYRWASKAPDNLTKKKIEGWETVNAVTNPQTTAEAGHGRINDGKPLTSAQERSDAVLMRIPEDMAEQRDAYYNNESARRVSGLTAHLKKEMQRDAGNAPVHGEIKISSNQGTQVID